MLGMRATFFVKKWRKKLQTGIIITHYGAVVRYF